ncbi:MAG TPA: TIM barrel protein [Candidatus Hydrogenedentes bacterium]|jgi:sugar phosphate isomerase/epimerase|nr:sugar phosphate isomerase/epimerase [Candidatus Hydrogenedentota bacterium]MDY0031425.1 TIM barrel protein [FCB group bacterium]NLT60058.1 TIM barrel protein [Candidatus Hydrogenedentota bacterium]HNZ19713.1 TIM barrel protein [Candidatus Hydrogenedentota bacterium]HOH35179.1 TIM barrel protein [Candidatus Hydrogenedentota bacterium]
MYLSIRDAMVAGDEFPSPIAGLRHLAVEAVEVRLSQEYQVYAMDSKEMITLASDEDAAAYRKHLDGLGIRACCFMTAKDFSTGDRESNAAWVARAIELADIMGMSVVRIDSAMSKERELDFEKRVQLFAEGLGGALERTAGSKVALGIENHGFQGNNLAFQLNVYQTVNSDRLGATMDTGNFYWRGYPLSEVYGILRILAPYAKHTHAKNINYPEDQREITREPGWEYARYACPLDEGNISHAKVLRMLADAGYDGDVCIENESLGHYKTPGERIEVLERDVAHCRAIIQDLALR